MSSIIDETLFPREETEISQPNVSQLRVLARNICIALKSRDEHFSLLEARGELEAVSRIEVGVGFHLVRLGACGSSWGMRMSVALLGGSAYYRSVSQDVEILMKKELVKRQRDCPIQFNFCIHQRRVIFVLNHFFVAPTLQPQHLAKIYIRIIANNVAHFTQIQQKFLKIFKDTKTDECTENQTQRILFLSKALSTTQSNAQLSSEKSQYKFAMRQIQKQNTQIITIQKNIVLEKHRQRGIRQLFLEFPETITSEYMRSNFIHSYRKNIKAFKHLLETSLPYERREEDYLHSIVQVQLLSKLAEKPIGIGGTSFIFPFKAFITFQNQQRVERHIVKKQLRPGADSKPEKLVHQKAIVGKLSNSICHFLPKYYSTESRELSSCLIMEMIMGDELDICMLKYASLSLWSKIYITLNVIQGIRHLLQHGIVHLDLKPANIIVSSQFITKIIDFGEAYHPDVCQKDYVPGYTFPYAAPEVISNILQRKKQKNLAFQYTEKQDAFSFGIILSEIFFKNSIFNLSSQNFKETYAAGRQLQRCIICPENAEAFGDESFMPLLLLIIQRCVGEPSKRPRFEWMNIILRLILDSYINID